MTERGRVIALSGRHASRAPIPAVGQLPDAETVFVGTLLWSPTADVAGVLEFVADDDFDSPALSVLVTTVRRLATAGRPCDAQMVMDELARGGGVHRGIALALMDATSAGAVPQAGRFYAAAVVAGSLRRRVESAGNALTEAAQDAAETDLAPIISRAAAACLDCAGRLAELRAER
ncbi:DnaB-like helicase N-terminal domain-containing protein [Mycobacterium marinum]|uniref:DnaB-like helicase N-terminal domain-containing protein n=1 Tax=Mycobacterium marinum TaxID=1781 RepID=UPI0015E19837|nr:DnaB-like helicase N-terminal domain-containing protein [Mycobacterium marinum]